MEATDLEGLNRRFLTERSKFTVELPKQREICPWNRGKHQEHTGGDQTDHSKAPMLKRSLNRLSLKVVLVPTGHSFGSVDFDSSRWLNQARRHKLEQLI